MSKGILVIWMTILDLNNAENPFFESIIFLCSHDLPFPVMYGMYINITCKYTTYRCISVYIQCTRMCLIVNLCKKKNYFVIGSCQDLYMHSHKPSLHCKLYSTWNGALTTYTAQTGPCYFLKLLHWFLFTNIFSQGDRTVYFTFMYNVQTYYVYVQEQHVLVMSQQYSLPLIAIANEKKKKPISVQTFFKKLLYNSKNIPNMTILTSLAPCTFQTNLVSLLQQCKEAWKHYMSNYIMQHERVCVQVVTQR